MDRYAGIIATVCNKFDVTMEILSGPRRTKNIVCARQSIFWLVRETCPGMSLPHIGRLLRRDHTTVLHGINRVKDLMIYDTAFRKWISEERDKIAALEWSPGVDLLKSENPARTDLFLVMDAIVALRRRVDALESTIGSPSAA